MNNDKKQTRDEFGELYIDELSEVRGGSDLRESLLDGRKATTLALGEEGPSPFKPPYHGPERPGLDLPWLRATEPSVPSADE
jgi:hypothetical protein